MPLQLIMTVLCVLMVLGALGFAGWTAVTGQIYRQGIDALFLVTVCLLIAAMFAPIPVAALRRGELRQWLQSRKRSNVGGGETNDPAAAAGSPESADKVKQQSV
jgi:hypothetical protein